MSERELNKVRLESVSSASEGEDAVPVSAQLDIPDGFESAVSDEGEGEVEYAVGEAENCLAHSMALIADRIYAIKYAVYRNSKKDRSDGWIGWHYHVMWSGFLKTGSDTEEGVKNFAKGGRVLPEFWKTYNGASVPRNRREPPGRLGDQHEPPDELLKKWFVEARPQRDFDAYNRRRTRLEQNKVQVLKADSDYYVHKARLAQKARQSQSETEAQRTERKAREKAQRKAEKRAARRAARLAEERAQTEKNARAGSQAVGPVVPVSATSAGGTKGKGKAKRSTSPNPALSSPESVKKERNPTPPINAVAGPSKLPTPPRQSPSRATSPADSLDILNSDHEVDAVLGDGRVERESSEVQEEVEVPVSAGTQGSKRKRILSSPALPESLPLGENTSKKSKVVDEPPDDPPPTATTSTSTSSKSDRLAAMGKIPKRIWVPGGDTNLEGMATGRTSEVFGSPQAGIFDAVETEEEEEPIEERRDRDDVASDKDSLFGGYEDDEMEQSNAPISATPVEQAKPPVPPKAPTSIKPLPMKPIHISTVQPVPSKPPATAPIPTTKPPKAADLPSRPPSIVPPSLLPSVSHYAPVPPRSAGIPPKSTALTSTEQVGSSTTVVPVVRPKYVQPTKLKLMEGLTDPERIKLMKRAGSGGQISSTGTGQVHVHRALQPSMGGVSPVNPTGGQSPLHPTSSFTPLQPPTDPAGFRPRPTPAFVPRTTQAVHVPPAPFALLPQPPSGPARPNQSAGLPPPPPIHLGVQPPGGPRGWNPVPMASRPLPTGPRLGSGVISPSGGLSPMGVSPGSYDASPILQQAELAPAHVPVITPAYNAASDPRRAKNPQQPPPPDETPPPPPSTAAPPSPPIESPIPPPPAVPQRNDRPSVDSSATGQHEITASCRLLAPIPADGTDITCGVRLLRGTPSTSYRELSLQGFLARDKYIDVWCETLDAFCLTAHLGYGATIVEWAKVIPVDREAKGPYADLKRQAFSENDPKIFATYTDTGPHRIDKHYAIVFAGSHIIDFEAFGLDLGQWRQAEMGLVALLVSLPLDSQPSPALPNPVNPEIEVRAPKTHPLMSGPCDLLDSYGLSSGMLSSFGGKFVQYRPGHKEGPLDDFLHAVKAGFKSVGVKHTGDKLDTFLIENARLFTAIRSTTMGNALPRRTTIMAMGPSLSLLPSQWKARTIWSNGGLVTFSPTFILRSPDKFAEIMRVIRPASSWAAYIVPSVVEWASMSWNEPTRCPDSTKTFECLTRSLFLDQHLLRFSGSAASSGGGLAISIAPPSIHQTDLCVRWSNWLRTIVDESDFNTLVTLCRGIRPGSFTSLPSANPQEKDDKKDIPTELELVDIEKSQIEDLVAMRMRPDLLPYRRYIYVGEMSLDRRTRDIVSGKGVEFVSLDDFVAVFSGAV